MHRRHSPRSTATPSAPSARRSGSSGLPRVLVVDDDANFRSSVLQMLVTYGCEAMGVSNGAEALAWHRDHCFDVIITELRLPGMTGLELVSEIRLGDWQVQIILISEAPSVDDAISALREGRAFDFLRKPLREPDELTATIVRALQRSGHPDRIPAQPNVALAGLTPRERAILVLLAKGMGSQELAIRLALKEKTVRNNLSNIYAKLGVKNRTQAVLFARENGII